MLFATLRASTMLGAAVALALLTVIVFAPSVLDAYGNRRRQEFELRWFERWQTLVQLAASDPPAARAAALEMSRELRNVHKLDRLATLVRLVERMRCHLAARDGNAAEAIVAGQRLVALDDRDIGGAITFAEALQLDGDRTNAAIAMLEGFAHTVPTHPRLIGLLAELHVAAGDETAAARVLVRAGAARRDPSWSVRWGGDVRQSTWCIPHRVDERTVALHFSVLEPTEAVSMRVTTTSALMLTDPVLTVQQGDRTTVTPLAATAHRLENARFVGGHLIVDGEEPATIELVALPRTGRATTLTLTADWRTMPARWLRDLVLGPVGERASETDDGDCRSALQTLRREAFGSCLLTVRAGSDARRPASFAVVVQASGDGFAAQFALPESVTEVEVRLPTGLKSSYADLALLRGDRVIGRAVGWHDLERADGGRATGPEPRLDFTVPPLPEPCTLTFRGRIE